MRVLQITGQNPQSICRTDPILRRINSLNQRIDLFLKPCSFRIVGCLLLDQYLGFPLPQVLNRNVTFIALLNLFNQIEPNLLQNILDVLLNELPSLEDLQGQQMFQT